VVSWSAGLPAYGDPRFDEGPTDRSISLLPEPGALAPELDASFPAGRIATNADGLRTRLRRTRDCDVVGILIMGDSVTFGFGVDHSETCPQ